MTYIPKSKVNILTTGGDELIISSTKEPFMGTYMELSNGTYYAGNNPRKPGVLLLKPIQSPSNFEQNQTTKFYSSLKTEQYKTLIKKTQIPSSNPLPIEIDYKRGYFTRYFCKKVNEDFMYFEIDKKTFDLINQKKAQYDFNLYQVGTIKWALTNNIKGTQEEINANIISLKSKLNTNISILFNNLEEYGVLETKGGELFDIKGRSYVGPYHIHPEKGPMVGPFHINKSHGRLYTNKKALGQLASGGRKNTPNLNRGELSTAPSRGVSPSPSVSSSPSGPSLSSGGGRGGY